MQAPNRSRQKEILTVERETECTLKLNEGTDDEMIYFYYILCLLTCGFMILVGYWKAEWKHIWTHKRCPISLADSIIIKDRYNVRELAEMENILDFECCDQETESENNLKKIFFEYRCIRYYWNEKQQTFLPLRGLETGCTCREIRYYLSNGLSNQQACRRLHTYKQNLIDVTVKSYLHLLVEEVLNPFYVFQIFSIIFWMADYYYYYASCILTMSLFSIITTLIQTHLNRERLRKMVATSSDVQVIRSDSNVPQDLSSTDLVPGDLIIIPTKGIRMECDVVLISGNCVVNESSLTGESNPFLKTELIEFGVEADAAYNPNVHKQHTLFAGTQVLQARSLKDSHVMAIVIRTGFYTLKGNLVRDILYPKPMDLKLYRDAYGFLSCMAVLAVAGMIYSVAILIRNNVSTLRIIARVVDVITIAVPPALPVALSIGAGYASYRLKKSGIYCINPSRINLSGKIDLVCFDKTGTLTEDFAEFSGVRASANGRFLDMWTELEGHLHDIVTTVMATCHSLTWLRNEICGDPTKIAMFHASKWLLDDSIKEGYLHENLTIQSLIRVPPESSDNQQNQLYGILKRFEFTSELKRMSVIIHNDKTRDLELVMKGAPETVIHYCNANSVPDDFLTILESYTSQGCRILGLAHKPLKSDLSWQNIKELSRHSLEQNMSFVGLLILRNKLKPETFNTIKDLAVANIRTVMITGDNLETAIKVAEECEIIQTCDNLDYLAVEDVDDDLGKPNLIYKRLKSFREDQLLEKGAIFARCCPKQKAQLVEFFKDLGYFVGMCGDGANDCGALKAAHAGISLSEAEASIASPFTSKIANISCVITLIREGRAALTTSFSVFMYLALSSMIQFLTIMILYWFAAVLGDLQFLYIDLFLVFFFVLAMSRALPYPKLSPLRPNISLLSLETLVTVSVLITIIIAGQAFNYVFLAVQPWYSVSYETKNGLLKMESYESTTLFYYSCYQYIWLAVVLLPGPPFQERVYKNWLLMLTLISSLLITTIIVIYPGQALQSFKLKVINDYRFKTYLIIMGLVYLGLSLMFKAFIKTMIKIIDDSASIGSSMRPKIKIL
ncbi:putative cation-transporting ATPase 13A3 [Trichoplax sp. H2]|nr:putative cation-transporting ATPase 13A3 [Trichoplax sp. H2]|eukprot:RDD38189.1 putative cation-transporting ATPase 13A3 [Trichoplax sp. H2]